jgi:hypothetical protein
LFLKTNKKPRLAQAPVFFGIFFAKKIMTLKADLEATLAQVLLYYIYNFRVTAHDLEGKNQRSFSLLNKVFRDPDSPKFGSLFLPYSVLKFNQ